MMQIFARERTGIRVRLPKSLARFLSDVPGVLATVGLDPDDPAAPRMNVPVYLDDPGSNAEYWRWTASDLDEGRRDDRSIFVRVVESGGTPKGIVVSDDEAAALVRVLAETRLVLAARMGIEVESDYEQMDEAQAEVLDVLAHLQLLLINELSA
jgi:hypothetical protein